MTSASEPASAPFRSGSQTQQELRAGALAPAEWLEPLTSRINRREPDVLAWQHRISTEALVERASSVASDAPLAGFSVGLKDIIDTRAMPTEYGSPIYAGHRPDEDARCVRLLEQAGAVVFGKTVTCEFATYHPDKTRNPHRPDHTPGGSSSGSAAAVADGHVAVALGTQTVGSVIRPASFCGTLGFKPSYGRYSYAGIKRLAPSYDTLGLFARSFDDLLKVDAVLADELQQPEGGDRGDCGEAGKPVVAVLRTPWDDRLEPAMRRAFDQAVALLETSSIEIVELVAPSWLGQIEAAQGDLVSLEAKDSLAPEMAKGWDLLSPELKRLLGRGETVDIDTIQQARLTVRRLRRWVDQTFASCDFLFLPSAPGAAPKGLSATGDPIFCRPWSASGEPSLGFPIGVDESGLPLGAQLVGRFASDRALVRQAQLAAGAIGCLPAIRPNR